MYICQVERLLTFSSGVGKVLAFFCDTKTLITFTCSKDLDNLFTMAFYILTTNY